MKKSILYYSLIMLVLCCTSSCHNDYEDVKATSLIRGFYNIEKLELRLSHSDNIYLSVQPYEVYTMMSQKPDDRAYYTKLCESYQDNNFNKMMTKEEASSYYSYTFSSIPIRFIDITSNQIFNENHPANTSLKDIVNLLSVSPQKYIQSAYKTSYNWENIPENFLKDEDAKRFRYDIYHANYPIDIKLSEAQNSDFTLLGHSFQTLGVLIFNEQPTTKGVHEFTVTLTLENGKSFSASIEKNFE